MPLDPESYPGPRPEGPVLVHRGRVHAVAVDGTCGRPVTCRGAPPDLPVLDPDAVRWCLAYGANACVDRLGDRRFGFDRHGALLLPAVMTGWTPAWEARTSRHGGNVVLTLAPAPGEVRDDVWLLGIPESTTARLDDVEGRLVGRYALGRIGPIAVAARFSIEDALAYGPGPDTRVLADDVRQAGTPAPQGGAGRPVTLRDADQAGAAERHRRVPGWSSMSVAPLPRAVGGAWPATPLADLPLFVYGSLQPGQERWPHIADLVEVAGPASTRGRLTATPHGWPAAEQGRTGTIHGTLLRPRDPQAARDLYRRADAVEAAPELFVRRSLPVLTGAGDQRWAAAYLWNPDRGAPPGAPIPDGRWGS